MMPRMKWYWRTTTAWVCGILSSTVCYFTYGTNVEYYILSNPCIGFFKGYLINFVAYCVNLIIVIGVYHWLTAPRWMNGITSCGKCGYALKGLAEPRCSECGHHI